MRTTSVQRVGGIDYEIMDASARRDLNQIADISDIITPVFGKIIFEVANLNSTTGEIDLVDGTRLASGFVYLSADTTITSTDFEFVPYRYNASKEYIGVVGSWARSFTVSNAGYYRLTVRIYNSGSSSVIGKEIEAQNDIVVSPAYNKDDYAYYEKLAGMSLKLFPLVISPSTYSTDLPDANNASKNIIYRLSGFSDGSTSIPAHLPYSAWQSGWDSCLLITTGAMTDEYTKLQIFVTMTAVYIRRIVSGTWQNWVTLSETPEAGYTPMSAYYASGVIPSNYQNVLPSADSVAINAVYRITGFTNGSSSIPAGLPKAVWDSTWANAVLMCFSNDNDLYARVQIFFSGSKIYQRNYANGAWNAWQLINSQNTIRVSALGAGDYTSFSEAIIAAFAVPNTTVYVERGTYDVYAEMQAIMGDDYWDELTESTQYAYGLPWGNGMKIIGSPGAEIVFDGSQTDNDNAWYYFSPLMGKYVYGSDKVVSCEGLTFRVTKFRYAIHIDEGPINNDYTYIVRDCQFYCDNTGNNRTKGSDAVGMGASINTTYIVENNYVESIYDSTARDHENIYYHNTNAQNPMNKCRINNNYFANTGTIRVDEYGESQNHCLVQIFGNSCGSALILPTQSTGNLNCVAWNNEIRT